MRTSDFDFDLPPELIAQQPAHPRDAARLMVLDRGVNSIAGHVFSELPSLLLSDDLLVVNDTRVMAARLHGHRVGTGGAVEALLLQDLGAQRWETLFRPARSGVPGREFTFAASDGPLMARAIESRDGMVVLEFERRVDPASAGEVPLPPYIKQFRGDPEEYQTVYSREPRSAAAPTAGLHFTPELLDRIRARNIGMVAVTLHVGTGTFRPVSVDDPNDHHLHAEFVSVGEAAAKAIQSAKRDGRRVVAVGTTVVRTLEHVARERGEVVPYEGLSQLKLLPGDSFKVIDALITNFHLPRSTLLMLVCAFAGQEFALEAYRRAVAEQYRFYSFGDAMLIV